MPKAVNRIIPRRNLMNTLDSIAEENFIYICAPAGYGKTVTVRQWIKHRGFGNAFISLDEFDNSVVNLCTHVCAALKACQPNNIVFNELITHAAFNTAAEEFTFRAISVLVPQKETIVAIDDLHILTDARSIKLVYSFIRKLSEKFSVIVISRYKLPKYFSESWLRNNASYLTEDDLRFSAADVLSLYESQGISITLRQAEEIRTFTNGWAIGINAMLLSGESAEGSIVGHLDYLDKFIEENLWQRWNDDIREFMIDTSAVSEVTAELCDLLTGRNDSEFILGVLLIENAFISCTDNKVYKYHDLFHNFLKVKIKERGEEYRRELLRKAGDWYLANGEFYKAIDTFINTENYEGIARCFGLLVTSGHEYFFAEKLMGVANSSFIHSIAELYPYAYSVLSWAAFNEGRAEDMARFADKYYMNQEKIVRFDPRLALNIMLVGLIDFRQTLFELAKNAAAINVYNTSKELDEMGVKIGIINQNMPFLHRGTRDFSECAAIDIESNVTLLSKALGGLFGEQTDALAECIAAGLFYEQDVLEKAHRFAASAVSRIKPDFSPEVKLCAISILVYVLDALEQEDRAEQFIENMDAIIEQDKAYYLTHNWEALKARRKLQKGDMKTAKAWLANHKTPLDGNLDFYRLYIHTTTARAYITNGNFDFAIILLKKILTLSTQYNRPLDIIEANSLLAIACWKKKRGFRDEAMQYLEDAVLEAHNYGFVRIFAVDGAELKGMLLRLQKKVEQPAYESIIPSSFIRYICSKISDNLNIGLTSGQAVKTIKLTEKQKVVLCLLRDGKSYKEIAENMNISNTTVRSHVESVYNKLSVTTKAEAVAEAKKLGVFD